MTTESAMPGSALENEWLNEWLSLRTAPWTRLLQCKSQFCMELCWMCSSIIITDLLVFPNKTPPLLRRQRCERSSHCGASLVREARQDTLSLCRNVSVGGCSKLWALSGACLQFSFQEENMGWKLPASWGGSRRDTGPLLLRANLQGVYTPRKLFVLLTEIGTGLLMMLYIITTTTKQERGPLDGRQSKELSQVKNCPCVTCPGSTTEVTATINQMLCSGGKAQQVCL